MMKKPRHSSSRVIVVGAGAVGNEVIKNLALLGVGHIHIVDMDRIERFLAACATHYRPHDEMLAALEKGA